MLVEAQALETLTSFKFLQNCATIGDFELYQSYCLPILKTISSIITSLESHQKSTNSNVSLDRSRAILSTFIEKSTDALLSFYQKEVNSESQYYLTKILIFTAFTPTNEINIAIWSQMQMYLPKIFAIIRDSTTTDEKLNVQWILSIFLQRLVNAQINSARDVSIHWDMLRGSGKTISLKTVIDLVEPVTRKIGDLERTKRDVDKNLENIDNLAVSSLEKIAGDYDENIEINELRLKARKRLVKSLKDIDTEVPMLWEFFESFKNFLAFPKKSAIENLE